MKQAGAFFPGPNKDISFVLLEYPKLKFLVKVRLVKKTVLLKFQIVTLLQKIATPLIYLVLLGYGKTCIQI